MIKFVDKDGTYKVYQHMDGYPEGPHGILGLLQKVIASGRAWELPRFEADEFAAAFVCVAKTSQGNVRLVNGGAWDVAYTYTVKAEGNELVVTWNGDSNGKATVSHDGIIPRFCRQRT